MEILIIGSAFYIEKTTQIIRHHFHKTKTRSYVYDEPHNLADFNHFLQENEPECDAVLFTGILSYQAALGIYSPSRPWAYIRRDDRQLLKALLKAQAQKKDWDILNLSLDSYNQQEVASIYTSIGVNLEELQVKLWRGSIFNKTYISECTDFHRKNINSGSSFAVTGTYPVYQRLRKMDLPVALLEFDNTAVIQAIEKLQLNHLIDSGHESIQMDFRILVQDTNPISILGESDRNTTRQYTDLLDKIYFFAHKHNAAVYDLGGRQFCLATHIAIPESDDCRNIVSELLLDTKTETLPLAIGVGLGKTSRYSKACAEVAYREALKQGAHCAFIAQELNHVIGPLMPIANPLPCAEAAYKDAMFSDLAYQTGISTTFLSEIKKLYLSVEHLTTEEITEATGFSLRKVNRLLAKLEDCHGIRIIGNKLNGARGRPLRVIQVLY